MYEKRGWGPGEGGRRNEQGTDEGSQEGCFPKQGEPLSQGRHLEQEALTEATQEGPREETPGSIRRQGSRRKAWARAFIFMSAERNG